MESAMESHKKCLRYEARYGELYEVSPLWSQLWRAIENVSVMESAMESYRKCLRYEVSYGEL
jgi:hypothetical protein